MSTYSYDIELDSNNTLEAEVHYTYNKGEDMVWTLDNGDPGTPGHAPSVEITNIFVSLPDANKNSVVVDILPNLFWALDIICIEDIEEQILKSYE